MQAALQPALFARLMFLDPQHRADLLEYLGGIDATPQDIERIIEEIESHAGEKTGKNRPS